MGGFRVGYTITPSKSPNRTGVIEACNEQEAREHFAKHDPRLRCGYRIEIRWVKPLDHARGCVEGKERDMAKDLSDFANSNVFDSRDVQERINELDADAGALTREERDELAALREHADKLTPEQRERVAELEEDEGTLDSDEQDELEALQTLADDAGREWSDGMAFIAEEYFEDYARELAVDIGAIPRDGYDWPANRIDWEAAADDLKMDYTSYELGGYTFYARA